MSRESGNGTIILWTSLDSCGYLQEATEVLCSLADNNSFLSQIIPQKNSRILARLKVLGKECHACLCMCLCMWTYAACMHACHSVWVCVCVNSCALRTSQAPISFVSVIPAGVFQLPSSMLLEQTIEFARRQSAKKTAKVSKRMMLSETHVLPMTVCISGSRISKKWDQFSIIHAYSACIHVM